MRVKPTSTLLHTDLWAGRKRQGAGVFKWHVFFLEGDLSQRAWWHLFCREGFGHVLALRYDPERKFWLQVDWNHYCLEIKAADNAHVELIFSQLFFGGSCVLFKPQWQESGTARSIALYCVSAIKHLLGVKSWALTPFQLYGHLMANGGTEIFAAGKSSRSESNAC